MMRLPASVGPQCTLHRGSRALGTSPSISHLSHHRRAAEARRAAPWLASGDDVRPCSFDVVTLGNLCVDVVVHVPQLPPADAGVRKALLKHLSQQHVEDTDLEVGGNCNFIIAAARLGLRVAAVGHTGKDHFGSFLNDVLQVLSRSRALFTNGFMIDELPVSLIQNTITEAVNSGVSIFFDPGPRCFTMEQGDRRQALCCMLDMSDVVLMTMEEATIVTHQTEPEAAAHWVMQRSGARTKWCVVKLGETGSLAVAHGDDGTLQTCFVPAFEVNVVDTVGCGDSFAAAVVLGFLQGQSLMSTLQLANAVGAATAMGRGAGRNVAKANAVQSLLETQLQAGDLYSSPIDMLRTSLDS